MDPSMWPRAALCETGGLRVRDPISEWADARPDLFGQGDARFQTLEYRRTIRDYLKSQGLVRSRTLAR
jgi:hypothetical protein